MSGEGLYTGVSERERGESTDSVAEDLRIAELVTEGLGQIITPEEEFELGYSDFQAKYLGFSAEEFPDEAYEDYRALEDVFIRCSQPSRLNEVRIKTLREIIQRYAESHKED